MSTSTNILAILAILPATIFVMGLSFSPTAPSSVLGLDTVVAAQNHDSNFVVFSNGGKVFSESFDFVDENSAKFIIPPQSSGTNLLAMFSSTQEALVDPEAYRLVASIPSSLKEFVVVEHDNTVMENVVVYTLKLNFISTDWLDLEFFDLGFELVRL